MNGVSPGAASTARTGVGGPTFSIDRASPAEIRAHLVACDAFFVPPLSQRVNLGDYARKLHARAARFEAWSAGALVGLVAAYLPDEGATGDAFVTNVSVLPAHTSGGIATKLLAGCLAAATARGCRRAVLEVGVDNVAALHLYDRLGFTRADVPVRADGTGPSLSATLTLQRALQPRGSR